MSGVRFSFLSYLIEIPNANSVDPDQTPRSAAADLCLHCLPRSQTWDARHEWVNEGYSKEYINWSKEVKSHLIFPTSIYLIQNHLYLIHRNILNETTVS